MKISHALRQTTRGPDPLLDPDCDGIARNFAAGKLHRDEAISAWISLGVEKWTAFRWLTLAEGS